VIQPATSAAIAPATTLIVGYRRDGGFGPIERMAGTTTIAAIAA
jgi:hypothetical protein